jgi:membrane-associated phospholipid phosphatase
MESKNSFFSYKLEEWARDITSLANPLILVFVPFVFLQTSSSFFTLLLALLVNEVVGSLIKLFFHKKRPNGQTYSGLLEKIDAGSFPSLHASRITLVYLTLFTNAENTILKCVFITVILLVILSRVKLKKHFWIDVLGGLVLGGILWYFSSY